MPLKVEDIDWSPLQVMTAILRKHAVKHVIIGGVALLHYQVIPTLDEGFVSYPCANPVHPFTECRTKARPNR